MSFLMTILLVACLIFVGFMIVGIVAALISSGRISRREEEKGDWVG